MSDEFHNVTVRDIGEVRLIELIEPLLFVSSKSVEIAVGDDCALLSPISAKPVLTVDTMVEGIHFDFGYFSPVDLGHRLLAANLSDIASMGAIPGAGVISLSIPPDTLVDTILDFYRGLSPLAERYDLSVVGGDIVGGKDSLVASLTVFGTATGNVLTRAGANTEDVVLLTGELGLSEIGRLHLNDTIELPNTYASSASKKHLHPEPRLDIGRMLVEKRLATACIDTSDSLATSLKHMSKASGVGFAIDVDELPVAEAIKIIANELSGDVTKFALNAGEDFELLFTASSDNASQIIERTEQLGVKCTIIGKTTPASEGIVLIRDNIAYPLEVDEFDHFAK
ncbi:MAG: Thiamine-monophosphate kinase [Candidatus Methanophagaceae archaeon]|nr:MAG: Thiamine-monophosphate kinase [Methanophagales archaeon]KAF5434741.1 thiamine-monophosphate kinase [Methanophagales archaeon]